MLALYSFTIFLSAFLLFSVQPLVGKLLLPLLGGTPGVWNVCMVFFQTLLFFGYSYAAALESLFKSKAAKGIHLILWITAGVVSHQWVPQSGHSGSFGLETHPTLWLLVTLSAWIGVPFFALTSTSTLIQNWLGSSPHPAAKDPYFLYAASNGGSLLALLTYPTLIEPNLSVGTQIEIWKTLFLILGVCMLACTLSSPRPHLRVRGPGPVNWHKSLSWILYALVPSSLLTGVTTYVSTDIAPIPLLWVVPLTLYILTFVLVFSKALGFIKKHEAALERLLGMGVLLCVVGMSIGDNHPGEFFIPLHLLTFFLSALLIHANLAAQRPAPSTLGAYFLCLALGGALGSMINSLVAPLLFDGIVEYPLAMSLVGLMVARKQGRATPSLTLRDGLNSALIFISSFLISKASNSGLFPTGKISRLFILGVPLILVYRKVRYPKSYALALLAFYCAGTLFVSNEGYDLLLRKRTFYGTIRVIRDRTRNLMSLFHGSTLHGQQNEGSVVPLTYFHPSGPAGDLFEFTRSRFPDPLQTRVGIVGMGTGSLASYARAGEQWTIYELDPGIIAIAAEKKFFTFLSQSAAQGRLEIIPGDARLKLNDAPPAGYSLILMDAFSSDSIPTHLLTEEAVRLYWNKTSTPGFLAFHISNRYFDLVPVLHSLALRTDSIAFFSFDVGISANAAEETGKQESRWAVLVRKGNLAAFLALLPKARHHWKRADELERYASRIGSSKGWTDDYFDLLSVLARDGGR
ncbi:MAG: fused MFS/spermidine synthase [Bdellovibrionales bacterium]|nr:fused MFS/spermidine synthase [Bdellovibrionales bacterium]